MAGGGRQSYYFSTAINYFLEAADYKSKAQFAGHCEVDTSHITTVAAGTRQSVSAEMLWRMSYVLSVRLAAAEKWHKIMNKVITVDEEYLRRVKTDKAFRIKERWHMQYRILWELDRGIARDYVASGDYDRDQQKKDGAQSSSEDYPYLADENLFPDATRRPRSR